NTGTQLTTILPEMDITGDFASAPATATSRGGTIVSTASDIEGAVAAPSADGLPIYSRHMGNCLAVMADGHVQIFKSGQIRRDNFAVHSWAWDWGSSTWVTIDYP
ncbi:MAG: hypothetical protein JO317_05120, partial [Verrucomicrobiae bacterium]|nr:hypothetical protein [Verrucomicrobiae bacterium]